MRRPLAQYYFKRGWSFGLSLPYHFTVGRSRLNQGEQLRQGELSYQGEVLAIPLQITSATIRVSDKLNKKKKKKRKIRLLS